MKNVLVVAAHPDDELLGVGGTIRKLADQGITCRAVIIGEGITSRSNARSEADAQDLVNLKEDARKAANIVGYETIDFCELPDNRLDGMDLLDVIKVVGKYVGDYEVERIYAFETPSSTEWNYTYTKPFTPNLYIDVTETLEAKVEGMECYRSESTEFPHPRSAEALRALGTLRGSNVGMKKAEAFMILREVIR